MRRLQITLVTLITFITLTAYALDPAIYDISMQAGEDFRLQLTLKGSNGIPHSVS